MKRWATTTMSSSAGLVAIIINDDKEEEDEEEEEEEKNLNSIHSLAMSEQHEAIEEADNHMQGMDET